MVSDFINDPPSDSPYYNQNETPYLKYKEAMDKCLQGGDEFPLMNVSLRPFVLTAPLDSIESEIDEWWDDFLSSITPEETPAPEETPVPEVSPTSLPYPVEDPNKVEVSEEYEDAVRTLSDEYGWEEGCFSIHALDEKIDMGKISTGGMTFKRDFEIICSYELLEVKEISLNVSLENFRADIIDVKFLEDSSKGLEVKDNSLVISSFGEEKTIPFSVEVTVEGAEKLKKIPAGKVKGNIAFELTANIEAPDEYNGMVFLEAEQEKFPLKEIKAEESFPLSFSYPSSSPVMVYVLMGLAVIILIIILIAVILYFAGSSGPVSVSLKLEGMPPVIHTYELRKKGFIEIKGGTFVTPDQFELPDVDGLAATVQRRGNKFAVVPDKGAIVNDSGEAVNVEQKINLGDSFTIRVDRVSGGSTDFHFSIQKASLQDWDQGDNMDTPLLDDGNDMAGKIDSGDLLF